MLLSLLIHVQVVFVVCFVGVLRRGLGVVVFVDAENISYLQ